MEIVARPGSAAGTAGCRAPKRKLRELAQGLAGFADTGVSLQVRPKQCVDGGPILEGPHAGLLQEPVVNRDRQVGQGVVSPVLHGFSVARAATQLVRPSGPPDDRISTICPKHPFPGERAAA
jgi:hypothetical protein